jgi:uncharacterized protein YukE
MGKFEVGIHALRSDAQIWDQESGRMKQIAQKANGLQMDRLQAGIFQVFVSSYQSAVNEVVARSDEGSTAMTAVADTLNEVANAYQQDESSNTYRFKDLH